MTLHRDKNAKRDVGSLSQKDIFIKEGFLLLLYNV